MRTEGWKMKSDKLQLRIGRRAAGAGAPGAFHTAMPGLGVLSWGGCSVLPLRLWPHSAVGLGSCRMRLVALWGRGGGLNFPSQAHLKILLPHGIFAGGRDHVSPRGDPSWDSWSPPFCTRGNSSLVETARRGGTRS